MSWLQDVNRRALVKKLSLAMAAGLLAGAYMPQVYAKDYNAIGVGIQGRLNADKKLLGEDIVAKNDKGQLVYTFTGDNNINVSSKLNSAGINSAANADMVIETGGTLGLHANTSVAGANAFSYGINHSKGGKLTINGNLDISAHTNSAFATGINVGITGTGTGVESHLTINGNVAMRDKANAAAPWAISSGTIHGGYGPDGWVTDAPYYQGARWAPAGISLGAGNNSTITVNGDVDMAVRGNAIVLNNYYPNSTGTINLNGNVTIDTPNEYGEAYYAIMGMGGTVNLGAKEGSIVKLTGNIISMNNANGWGNPYFYQDSTINMGLTSSDSYWKGVVDNAGKLYTGTFNLDLQNGAAWEHRSMSKTNGMDQEHMPDPSKDHYGIYDGVSYVTALNGGASAAKQGIIIQRDGAKIDIGTYKGFTTVIYEHLNNGAAAEDYKAGDVIIHKALQNGEGHNAGIVLSTDNANIQMSDKQQVAAVLNALAGKLYYMAYTEGEHNLDGKVQIASGLVASSAALADGAIVFDKDTGKGAYDGSEEPDKPDEPGHQVKVDFYTGITGDKAADKEYVDGGVLKDDGTYVFEKNSNVNIADATGTAISSSNGLNIKAEGNTLKLKASKYGIRQELAGAVKIATDTVSIDVGNADAGAKAVELNSGDKQKAASLTINGNVRANVAGSGGATGIYAAGNSRADINGSFTMKGKGEDKWGLTDGGTGYGYYGSSAIYAGSNYTIQQGGEINIKGLLDLAVDGNGAFANGGGSKISIKGGTIEVNKDRQLYALLAQSGYVNMNMNDAGDGAGTSRVNIKGNVGLLNGAVSSSEPVKDSVVNLGMSTGGSTWTGVADNNFTDANKAEGFDGKFNLYLSNNAYWTNEAYGKVSDGFRGSQVDKLAGGATAKEAGNILQRDAHRLTIGQYSGFTNIYYEHDNAGAKMDDYKAGDVLVKNATAGSRISVLTDSSGINMKDNSGIEATLSALAQKLVYESADKNLTGQVGIASSLTSSAVQLGDIDFSGKTGSYINGSVKPGVDPDIDWGDYETYMMRGVRSSLMHSMLSWRELAGDVYDGVAQLPEGEQMGVWARAYGGKAEYKGSADVEGSYWTGQVGYSRMLDNGWDIGAAIDYQNGNGTYLLGGKGDSTLYDVGVYGSRELAGGRLRLAAKFGHIENEFEVYNEIGTKLKGDYDTRGYSLAAQYSKRFGKEAEGYLEPLLQLTWAHMDKADFVAGTKKEFMNVGQDAVDSLVGRIGVAAGREGSKGGLYTRLSLAHEFSGSADASYYAENGGTKKTSFDLGDTWSELTVGGHYNLSKCSSFYADITRSLSGDYQHQWKLNAGLNFAF